MRIFLLSAFESLIFLTGGCTSMLSSYQPSVSNAKREGTAYSLSKALVKVSLAVKSDKSIKVSIDQPTYVPDPDQRYLLAYHPSFLSSDSFTVTVDPLTGYLTKVDMTADDKTGEIVQAIAKIITLKEASSGEAGETVLIERYVDPLAIANLEAEFNTVAKLKSGTDPKLKFFIKTTGNTAIQASAESSAKPNCSVGICYRQPATYIIGFSFNSTITYESPISIPNGAPVYALNLKRSPFVTRKNTIELSNGSISSVVVDKPSEGLAVAQMPVDIARAVISVPAEILQLKIDLLNKEKGVAEGQAALIDALKALQAKKDDQSGSGKTKESSSSQGVLLSASSNGRITTDAMSTNPSAADATKAPIASNSDTATGEANGKQATSQE